LLKVKHIQISVWTDLSPLTDSFSRCKSSLKTGGRYLAVAGGLQALVQMLWTSMIGSKKVIFGGGSASERKDNLIFISRFSKEADHE
jgi:hypothetical protein